MSGCSRCPERRKDRAILCALMLGDEDCPATADAVIAKARVIDLSASKAETPAEVERELRSALGMGERVAMDSDLLERVGRRLCKQGGATWPKGRTALDLATINAYQQLAWAAVDEVLAWQSEQSVAAAGPDPFWKRSDLPIPRLNLERVDPMPKEKRDG